MASYQPCDSYFTESDDGNVFGGRPEARDYTKMIKHRKQEVMANELSRQAAKEYLVDIMKHMRQMEDDTLPSVQSIDIQQEIQWFMRPYLLDFLVEAHAAFQLLPETLFLAINLLDRYCSKRVVYKRHYQLVGCASLLIAAKYGDKKDRVPTIRELKSMCCSLYDEEMFTQMEWHVLNTLDWVIGHPTVDSFLQISLSEEYPDAAVEHMAWYICEIALYHKEFVSTKPSVMARTSLALARCILKRREVPEAGFDHIENLTLISLSHQLSRPSQVLAKKYASPHMSCVSTSLDQFLQQQAAIARCPPPPSPPSVLSIVQPKPLSSNYNGFSTPQKGQAHGYPTPPITPDGEYFGDPAYHTQPKSQGYPTTPSPLNSNPYVPSLPTFFQPYQQEMLH